MTNVMMRLHSSYVSGLFHVARALMGLEDFLQKKRCYRILHYDNGLLSALYNRSDREYHARGGQAVLAASQCLMDAALDIPVVTACLIEMRPRWRWLDRWVREYATMRYEPSDAARIHAGFRQWHNTYLTEPDELS